MHPDVVGHHDHNDSVAAAVSATSGSLADPLHYGFTPREMDKWRATHLLLAVLFGARYDRMRDEV